MKSLLPALLLMVTGTALASEASAGFEPSYCASADLDGTLPKPRDTFRFATFNAFLNRSSEGELLGDLTDASDQLEGGADTQIRAVAEIIQRVRPDVLLLNEFDYDEVGAAIELFQQNFLGVAQNGQDLIEYPYRFNLPSNTGVPSGVDIDGDGSVGGPGDAFGFGFFPGQFGMVLLSRYPILDHQARTFQTFLWRDMPGALLPDDETTPADGDFYSEEALAVFRLSSKSHWDVPVDLGTRVVHVLAAHPTPPVFDGPEDRNGRRNADEIRFWADYVGNWRRNRYIVDDAGQRGGLGFKPFVIMGDYNADPFDGDSTNGAITQLLDHPAIDTRFAVGSSGGAEDAVIEGGANVGQQGDAALDTADFNPAGPGNLRVDYVLPSERGLRPNCGGVFWPGRDDATRYLVGEGFPVVSSDHRLVWMDIAVLQRWRQD